MQNREITYYYLLADDILNHYYSLADGMPEDSFVKSGLEQRHIIHYNVHANNNAFLTHLAEQSDLKNLAGILQKQLARYLKHVDGDSIELKKGWLKQTIKICKDAYHQRKRKYQIWLEAADWCKKELTKNLKTPPGQQANKNPEKSKGGLSKPVIQGNAPTTMDYALFHYYKQEGKHEPAFEKTGNINKKEAMREQGKKYNLGGAAFAVCYYTIAGKKEKRITISNIPHIRKAVEMLYEYSAGKQIAEKELGEAELLA